MPAHVPSALAQTLVKNADHDARTLIAVMLGEYAVVLAVMGLGASVRNGAWVATRPHWRRICPVFVSVTGFQTGLMMVRGAQQVCMRGSRMGMYSLVVRDAC